jgi:hypothetical protein
MGAGDFRWNQRNFDHAQSHGCTTGEIEAAALHPLRGYPRKIGDGKYLAIGRGQGGRLVEVIFVRDVDGTMYVIHAHHILTRRKRRR